MVSPSMVAVAVHGLGRTMLSAVCFIAKAVVVGDAGGLVPCVEAHGGNGQCAGVRGVLVRCAAVHGGLARRSTWRSVPQKYTVVSFDGARGGWGLPARAGLDRRAA